jgi:hypothetical protein
MITSAMIKIIDNTIDALITTKCKIGTARYRSIYAKANKDRAETPIMNDKPLNPNTVTPSEGMGSVD